MSKDEGELGCVSCYRRRLFKSNDLIPEFAQSASCDHTYHPQCLFEAIRFDGLDACCLLCGGKLLNSNMRALLVEKGILSRPTEVVLKEFLMSKLFLVIFAFLVLDFALRTNNIFLSPIVKPLWEGFFSWSLDKDLIISVMNNHSRFNQCVDGSTLGCLLHTYDLLSGIGVLVVLAPCWLIMTLFHITFPTFG